MFVVIDERKHALGCRCIYYFERFSKRVRSSFRDARSPEEGDGMSLDREVLQLKLRVGKLERQVAFLLEHLGLEYYEGTDAGVSPDILELVRTGDKLRAIKLYREETGLGLREAKEFIESLEV